MNTIVYICLLINLVLAYASAVPSPSQLQPLNVAAPAEETLEPAESAYYQGGYHGGWRGGHGGWHGGHGGWHGGYGGHGGWRGGYGGWRGGYGGHYWR